MIYRGDTPMPISKDTQEVEHIEANFVIEATADDSSDLVSAAEISLGFWNNSYDDEDWNDVKAG
jgi:hypothetical protein